MCWWNIPNPGLVNHDWFPPPPSLLALASMWSILKDCVCQLRTPGYFLLHGTGLAGGDGTLFHSGEVADVLVSCDGTWQKRGFTSLYGIVFIIAHETGKVLDYHVMSKECEGCRKWEGKDKTSQEYIEWKQKHKCTDGLAIRQLLVCMFPLQLSHHPFLDVANTIFLLHLVLHAIWLLLLQDHVVSPSEMRHLYLILCCRLLPSSSSEPSSSAAWKLQWPCTVPSLLWQCPSSPDAPWQRNPRALGDSGQWQRKKTHHRTASAHAVSTAGLPVRNTLGHTTLLQESPGPKACINWFQQLYNGLGDGEIFMYVLFALRHSLLVLAPGVTSLRAMMVSWSVIHGVEVEQGGLDRLDRPWCPHSLYSY